MSNPSYAFTVFTADERDTLLQLRAGEVRLGERMGVLSSSLNLDEAYQQGYRYALLGVPEDIGPRANLGLGGATLAWPALLSVLLNMQSNAFMSGEQLLIAGTVQPPACSNPSTENLREACHQLDLRVKAAVSDIIEAGLIPIVIGGGHNNALPIIQACFEHFNQPLAVANLDPHSDFRAREGRHSGNPFRYAHQQGALSHYTVLGLHEQKNNHDSLTALTQAGFPFHTLQSWAWRRTHTLTNILSEVSQYLLNSDSPIGLELDVDAISNMPSSAMTACGVGVDDALYYVHRLAALEKVSYLHLAEAAPERHPAGLSAGQKVCGQVLSELICAFVKARLVL